MGIKREVVARMRGRWVKLDVTSIEESMKKIYFASGSDDLGTALLRVRDYYRDEPEIFEEAGFLAKLLQLEASGYIEPPLNFSEMYRKIANSLRRTQSQGMRMEIE